MAYADQGRIFLLESLLRDLARKHRELCEDYATIGGTTPENLSSLKEDLALIAQAEAALKNNETQPQD
jgi:hypothetical protein